MPTNNRPLLLDTNGRPIPQYFDVTLDQFVAITTATPLPTAGGGGSGGGLNTFAVTQTVIAVSANDTVLIAANALRKSLKWMVIGAADVTVKPGTTCTAGIGMVYQSSGSDGKQGGAEDFPNGCPTNAFACAAASATRIVVWEGA